MNDLGFFLLSDKYYYFLRKKLRKEKKENMCVYFIKSSPNGTATSVQINETYMVHLRIIPHIKLMSLWNGYKLI